MLHVTRRYSSCARRLRRAMCCRPLPASTLDIIPTQLYPKNLDVSGWELGRLQLTMAYQACVRAMCLYAAGCSGRRCTIIAAKHLVHS